MTRLNKVLAGVLVLQVLLAVLVLSRSGDTINLKQEPVLPGFDAATVTRLQIFENGAAKPTVDLVKGTAWVLASHWDYPADPAKIDAALAPLAKMTAGEDPVATSTSRHKQQKVADTDFDRKLVITGTGGKEITLFIGTTKARRTSVRLAGDERVLGATGVSTPSAVPRDWIAGSYSEIPRDDIDKISIQRGTSTLELDRTQAAAPAGSGSAGSGSAAPERTWRLAIDGAPAALAAGEQLDTYAIDTIVSAVSTIGAMPADPKRDASKPAATITVTKKDGVALVFDVVADGEYRWVKQRGLERATTVDKERLESVLAADRSKLVSKPEPVPGAGSGSAGFPPRPVVPPPPRPE
jgi:hypothetical protein